MILQPFFAGRQEADYDLDADIAKDEAKLLLQKAETFLLLTKEYFTTIGLSGDV